MLWHFGSPLSEKFAAWLLVTSQMIWAALSENSPQRRQILTPSWANLEKSKNPSLLSFKHILWSCPQSNTQIVIYIGEWQAEMPSHLATNVFRMDDTQLIDVTTFWFFACGNMEGGAKCQSPSFIQAPFCGRGAGGGGGGRRCKKSRKNLSARQKCKFCCASLTCCKSPVVQYVICFNLCYLLDLHIILHIKQQYFDMHSARKISERVTFY